MNLLERLNFNTSNKAMFDVNNDVKYHIYLLQYVFAKIAIAVFVSVNPMVCVGHLGSGFLDLTREPSVVRWTRDRAEQYPIYLSI